MSTEAIAQRASFTFVRYANCWEDPELLTSAAPGPGQSWLSIASAGDNAFFLLTSQPERVVAFDLSAAQLALCRLKRAALLTLDYEDLPGFLGFVPMPAQKRLELLRGRVAKELDSDTLARYANAPGSDTLAQGVILAGKFERYFRFFARFVLPLLHSRKERQVLLAEKSAEERVRFYDTTWNNRRYRLLFRLFFGRAVMGRFGRDPEFFRYVQPGDIIRELEERSRRALTELDTHDNPWLRFIVTGNFGEVLPPYLRRKHIDAVRAGLPRLELFQGGPAEVAARYGENKKFTAFNLSDIFEYMDEAACRAAGTALLSCARDGARFCYYNMMAPRDLSAFFPDALRSCPDLAAPLFAHNRAFFYGAYHIDELHKTTGEAAS